MLACDFQCAKEDAFEHLSDAQYSAYSAAIKRVLATAFLHPEDMPAELLFATWVPVALNALRRGHKGGWDEEEDGPKLILGQVLAQAEGVLRKEERRFG